MINYIIETIDEKVNYYIKICRKIIILILLNLKFISIAECRR